MRSKPMYYISYGITNSVINRIKSIAKSRYDFDIYSVYYNSVNNIYELCSLYDAPVENIRIAMGEDWFIIYYIGDCSIDILDWVGIEKVDSKFVQVKEMLNAFREILIFTDKNMFTAYIRHDTSYSIFSMLLEKGYLEEYYDKITIDICRPVEVDYIMLDMYKESFTLENYFRDNAGLEKTWYGKYFLHGVKFGITDKFVKRLDRKSCKIS